MNSRILLLLCGATVASAQSLTLDEAIRIAWANDPKVAAISLTRQLSRAREIQAGIRPNPEVDVRGSAPLTGDSEWSVGVGVSQRLPRRARVELARAYVRLGAEVADLEVRERRRLIAGEVRRLWYELALQEARLQTANRARDQQRTLLESIGRRRSAGEIADADWDLLQVEIDRSRHAVALAEGEHRGTLERLRQRLRVSEVPSAVVANLTDYVEKSLPAAPALNEANFPELALADLAVRRAEAAVALARAEAKQDVHIGAGIDFERRANDATGRLENEPQLSVAASVPWPRRVANRGEILEKEAALRIAEANRQALRDELNADLQAALAAAKAAQPAVRDFQALLSSAAALPEKLRAAYLRGEVTSLQLAQARQQQLAIENDYLTAVARYLAVLAEAETAAGLIPTQP